MGAKGEPTKVQREALRMAASRESGGFYPFGAGQYLMARNMERAGWGRFLPGESRKFTINDAGRRAAKGEA